MEGGREGEREEGKQGKEEGSSAVNPPVVIHRHD